MKLSDLLNEYINTKKHIDMLDKDIKNKRSELNEKKDNIVKYMKQKEISDLDYNDNKFILKNTNTYSTISQKHIKTCMNSYEFLWNSYYCPTRLPQAAA